MATKDQDDLLVHGYIKMLIAKHKIDKDIPDDIIKIFVLFYKQTFEIIKWSAEHLNEELNLIDDDKCVFAPDFRSSVAPYSYNPHASCVADIEPVNTGSHCWRLQLINPKEDWILIGVGNKKKFTSWDDNTSLVL